MGWRLITEIPGVADILALEDLHAGFSWIQWKSSLQCKLPDMGTL